MRRTPEGTTPDRRGLRSFSFTLAGSIAFFLGILLPWVWEFSWPAWPWFLAMALVLWGVVWPAGLAPLYHAWMRLGMLLHKIVSPLVLGLLFVLLFVPTALLLRLFRYDPLASRLDPDAASYRVPSTKMPREQMEKPY